MSESESESESERECVCERERERERGRERGAAFIGEREGERRDAPFCRYQVDLG